eukprot:CAMPEP_0194340448 /NCGR_PEP_ID=MMETSP0171-20130528/86371_1 /TAXON_ID=218684 /ORGANISM="Corethron pennatum, Strain L29A3" /LENGTH=343 /DNA_ID=CAMNT_0039105405 /DNA_START=57 /DNA_END=1084 /DNA_ORIENTATION=+
MGRDDDEDDDEKEIQMTHESNDETDQSDDNFLEAACAEWAEDAVAPDDGNDESSLPPSRPTRRFPPPLPPPPMPPRTVSVHVTNLPFDHTEEQLRILLSSRGLGTPTSVRPVYDPEPRSERSADGRGGRRKEPRKMVGDKGYFRGVCFVDFGTAEEAAAVVSDLDGTRIGGRMVRFRPTRTGRELECIVARTKEALRARAKAGWVEDGKEDDGKRSGEKRKGGDGDGVAVREKKRKKKKGRKERMKERMKNRSEGEAGEGAAAAGAPEKRAGAPAAAGPAKGEHATSGEVKKKKRERARRRREKEKEEKEEEKKAGGLMAPDLADALKQAMKTVGDAARRIGG